MERRIREIRTGSKPAVGPAWVESEPKAPEAPAALPELVGASVSIEVPFSKAACSRRKRSWFSRGTAVVARRWESLIGSTPSASRRGDHFSINCCALYIVLGNCVKFGTCLLHSKGFQIRCHRSGCFDASL